MAEHFQCPFEKAILSTECGCRFSTRYYVGERTGVACRYAFAHEDCKALMRLLRENARFALGVKDATEALPFGKEKKLLFGGLLGLYSVLDPAGQSTESLRDISGLVARAKVQFEGLGALPYSEIVRFMATYHPRRRGHVR